MTKRTLLGAVGIALVLGGAPALLPAQSAAPEHPNVILIMTDDAGYGDFGVYGAPDIKTPHIDSLARDGVRLTDFYANGATCTPTRAGLISGRYQQRYALEAPLGVRPKEDAERGLPPSDRFLPRLLKGAGYTTALIGKWHLGWKPEYSPNAHGFDEFFGFKSGFIDYYQHTAGTDAPLHADLFENDKPVEVAGYMTDLISDRAVRTIEQDRAKPFFVEVAYNAPHWPYQRPDQPSTARDDARHLQPFDRDTSTRADYVTMVERVDAGVGRILAALDRLDLRRRTIVIFTNDNGGEWLSHGGPLFHRKASVWEGGIRVPALVRWPGHIPAGRVSHQVGMTMDLTASILAAAGVAAAPETKLDGVNLLPILEGRAPEMERTVFWRVTGARQQQAVRSGRWKLVVDQARPLLFDLSSDIGERTDVIRQHVDVATKLRAALAAWEADVDGEAKGAASR
ncbi:MAG: sulfatase-like hydrolase/transferase [Vicinamibacteria bacterium]